MKRGVTKQEQSYINSLLKKRQERQLNKLFTVSQERERLSLHQELNDYVQRDGRTTLESKIEENYLYERK